VAKPNPLFDLINHLSTKQEYEYDIKDYTPWMINKAFSNTMDTVYFAEAMNKFSHLPKDIQRDFYLQALPAKKRYGKWNKATINNQVEMIMTNYQVNQQVAEKYLKLLSKSELLQLEEKQNKGGSSGLRCKGIT